MLLSIKGIQPADDIILQTSISHLVIKGDPFTNDAFSDHFFAKHRSALLFACVGQLCIWVGMPGQIILFSEGSNKDFLDTIVHIRHVLRLIMKVTHTGLFDGIMIRQEQCFYQLVLIRHAASQLLVFCTFSSCIACRAI